jgi:hypothetical protein
MHRATRLASRMQLRVRLKTIAIGSGLVLLCSYGAGSARREVGDVARAEPPGGLAEARLPFNDRFLGWPVRPIHTQHPVRSSFLDPRAPGRSREYHNGIDVGVRDDRPETDAPPGRTHRIYAIESGRAVIPRGQTTAGCANRRVIIGHFEYWHVDTDGVLKSDERVRPGETIGWTCLGLWHLHLSERRVVHGTTTWVNPLRPGGKVAPYVDRLAPTIGAIRFFTPAFAGWSIRGNPLRSPNAGTPIPASQLRGTVDARALVADPQSFRGDFAAIPRLQPDLHPYRVAISLSRRDDGHLIFSREVFRADVYLTANAPGAGLPILFDFHYAPGTVQALPARDCLAQPARSCGGRYWLRLFAQTSGAFWDTTEHPDGAYRLEVRAWDALGNRGSAHADVVITNR